MTWLIGCAIVAVGIVAGVSAGTAVGLVEQTWAVPAAIVASTVAVLVLFRAGGWLG